MIEKTRRKTALEIQQSCVPAKKMTIIQRIVAKIKALLQKIKEKKLEMQMNRVKNVKVPNENQEAKKTISELRKIMKKDPSKLTEEETNRLVEHSKKLKACAAGTSGAILSGITLFTVYRLTKEYTKKLETQAEHLKSVAQRRNKLNSTRITDSRHETSRKDYLTNIDKLDMDADAEYRKLNGNTDKGISLLGKQSSAMNDIMLAIYKILPDCIGLLTGIGVGLSSMTISNAAAKDTKHKNLAVGGGLLLGGVASAAGSELIKHAQKTKNGMLTSQLTDINSSSIRNMEYGKNKETVKNSKDYVHSNPTGWTDDK